ncbi:MAG: DUF4157 domain-containing protein [Deltaproteobacteria bacterium]|nr:DUF4157 domain-containing protein [Deltaproteobacteria bacterium]
MKCCCSGTGGGRTDRFEAEADRFADDVMRAPVERSGPRMMRAAVAGARPAPSAIPAPVAAVLRSPGAPLDAATRGFMEPRLGHDLGDVRVHTDRAAAASATSVGARAYTVGRDVVFADGQYAPHTSEGRRLLAHELAHVVQQLGTAGALQRKPDDGYSFRLVYPPSHVEEHTGLAHDEARRVLVRFSGRIHASIEGGMEGHRALVELDRDQWIVSGVSKVLGGRRLPAMSIWAPAQVLLAMGRTQLDTGDLAGAMRVLGEAAKQASAANRAVYEYREGTIAGAERAVVGLEVLKVAGSVAASIAWGPGGGALYAGAQRLAGETSSVALGLQSSIDWGGVAFDTLLSLGLGKLFGNLGAKLASKVAPRLVAVLVQKLGGKISEKLAETVVVQGLSFVRSMLAGRLSATATAVARELFDGLRGRTQLTVDGFLERLAEAWSLNAILFDAIVHVASAGLHGRMQRAHEESAPPPPAPKGTPGWKPYVAASGPGPAPEVTAPPPPSAGRPPPTVGATALKVQPAVEPVAPGAPAPKTVLRPVTDADVDAVLAASKQQQPAPKGTPQTAVAVANAMKGKKAGGDDCPTGTIPIRWPAPTWVAIGLGDTGSIDPMYNRPPRVVTKRASPARSRAEVDAYNAIEQNRVARRRAEARGLYLNVHHKWPLFMSGPDIKDNFVFFPSGSGSPHSRWHEELRAQHFTIASPGGYIGTRYCVL